MGIYIKNMNIPKDKEPVLSIDEKGQVYIYGVYPTKFLKAIELPPHGRLIDADVLSQMFDSDESFGAAVLDIIADTPTVIEAERENDTMDFC